MFRRLVCTTLIWVFVWGFPMCALFAQEPPLSELLKDQPRLELVPKLVWTECAPEQRCADLENYRRYLQMRVQYTWLFDVHTKLVPSLVGELQVSAELMGKAEAIQAARADRAEKAFDDLMVDHRKAVLKGERAQSLSILGGGAVWVLTAFIAGVATGAVVVVVVSP